MKRLLTIIAMLVLCMPIVFAGVTNPLPSNIELKNGESGRFKFQVQAVNSELDMVCTYQFNEQPPFIVEWDEPQSEIAAGQRIDVYGTVTVPEDMPAGAHIAEFCVSCAPKEAPAGASVKVDTCGLPLKVTVVQERTRDNLYVPQKPEPKGVDPAIIALIAIIFIALLAFIILYLRYRSSTGKHVRKVRKQRKESEKRSGSGSGARKRSRRKR